MAQGDVSMLAPVALRTEPSPTDEPQLDFEVVYAEHFDFVWRNLRRLGVPESALRDAAQDVFLVVYRRLGEFSPHGTLRSWLYSILRRVALAHKRQYRQRSCSGLPDADICADESLPSPESNAVHNQSLRLLLDLLSRLDDDKRDALVSVDIEGMSVPEACMALDVNLNTLYSRLRAARHQMRQLIAQDSLYGWRDS
jgi:RNA polymerase sigma-70 factor (ECF subfamily)